MRKTLEWPSWKVYRRAARSGGKITTRIPQKRQLSCLVNSCRQSQYRRRSFDWQSSGQLANVKGIAFERTGSKEERWPIRLQSKETHLSAQLERKRPLNWSSRLVRLIDVADSLCSRCQPTFSNWYNCWNSREGSPNAGSEKKSFKEPSRCAQRFLEAKGDLYATWSVDRRASVGELKGDDDWMALLINLQNNIFPSLKEP